MRLRKKKFLSIGLIFLLLLHILPKSALAIDGQKQKNSKQAIDYALFCASKSIALHMNGSKINIKGDIHTNADFVYRGSGLSIDGTCEASRKVDVKGSKSSITSKIEGAPVIEMTNYTEDIKSIANVLAEVYKTDKKYNDNNIVIKTSVIVDGNIDINCSKFISNGYIIAVKDISLNASKIESEIEKGIVIMSETGNITFHGSSINLKGIIYAPKGTVTIDSANFTLNGRIIADKIIFKGSSLNVISSSKDYELINGYKLQEVPVLTVEKINEGFKLNWNQVNNAVKYTIMRKISQGQYEVIADNLTQNVYIDKVLDLYGIYVSVKN